MRKYRAMRSGQGFESFLEKWRDALRDPKPVWDGNRAVAELKRAGYKEMSAGQSKRVSMLSFVRCDPEHRWRPRDMLERVFAEVRDYKKRKCAWQKEFRDVELLLAGVERNVTKRGLGVKDSQLNRILANTAQVIERQRSVIHDFSLPAKRSPLGPWERLWPKIPRAERIERGIDLDTRLQVQAAKMFRNFLHEDEGVSLRTIARLVVLVYVVAGLASESKDKEGADGRLRIIDSGRLISVRNVEDKLRKKGIRDTGA